MPSRNLQRLYVPGHYYHVYNRGVEKRNIFIDDEDYRVMLDYLKVALSPDEDLDDIDLSHTGTRRLRRKKIDEKVDLLAYCLMPNHFHFLFYLHDEEGIQELMQSIMTGYVMYFNKKYDRVGSLFQGKYKASHIDNEAYLWHISRYIHRNPEDWRNYEYSSIGYYIGQRRSSWVKPEAILQLHEEYSSNYEDFLVDVEDISESEPFIEPILADS